MASNTEIDARSGFCKSNSIFYSKREPISLPMNDFLDVTTFISTRAHHGKIAFIDGYTGHSITFSEVWRAVDSVSTGLYDMGIRKGHVILLLSPNSIFFPIISLAVLSIGAILTTTNPLNTEREIAKQIADSKPVLAFTISQLIPKLAGSSLQIVLLDDQRTTSTEGIKVITTLEQMLQKQPTGIRVTDRVNQDDVATMLYSSGTTGVSKGVVTSHRSLIAMVQAILRRYNLADGQQTFICNVPMFHIYGLSWFAMGHLAAGSTTVILSKFDMNEMLSVASKYRVTYLPLAPPIVVAMVNDADQIRSKHDLSSVQSALSGGAPLSREVIEAFVQRYPNVKMLQGYGLTETAGIASSTDTLEESRKYGTVGLLSPSIEAKIVHPDSGKALSVNQTGELWLKGPTIMKGYFNNPEATKSTLDPEGWLKTGDLCYIDDDGFLFVVDRLKELIKYKGYQVAPAELEALLLTHPKIYDSAVIPFPDKEVGQFPMAYVVLKAGSGLSEKEVIDFVAKQVAPYKKIRRVAFVASIPKNPSGKILRRELVKLAISNL